MSFEGANRSVDESEAPVQGLERWPRRSISASLETVRMMTELCLSFSDPRSPGHTLTREDLEYCLPSVNGKQSPKLSEQLFRIGVQKSFAEQLTLFQTGQDILLPNLHRKQRMISCMMHHPDVHEDAIEELMLRTMLRPVIPVFYRTDRSMTQYRERFGFDLLKFMRKFERRGERQVAVEFGQGSGRSMGERYPHTRDTYLEFGICDVLRYQIDTFIDNLLNTAALEKEGVVLTNEERRHLCMSLYKIAVIRAGRTHEDVLQYDEEAAHEMLLQPAAIIDVLRRKAPLLLSRPVLPDDVGGADGQGNVIHPSKAVRPQSEAYDRAERLVASDTDRFIAAGRSPRDIRRVLFQTVYPAGTLIGDFSNIERLRANQVDLSFGVRSTAYLSGNAFTRFGEDLTRVLTNDGASICDGLRPNFDKGRYRLEEADEIRRQTGFPVHVVTGPRLEGEGARAKPVPLAMLLTQSGPKLDWLKANLDPGFSLTTPRALLDEPGYTRSLN